MQKIEHCLSRSWDILQEICDPEIPVLSILDLGMIRGVELNEHGEIIVRLTPTYSGCPATEMLQAEIKNAFAQASLLPMQVVVDLSEAWTTDWMTEQGKQKLKAYGIAPPQGEAKSCGSQFALPSSVECPHCASTRTSLLSEFSSTACKALYKCQDCLEPFDYFKCI